MDWRDKGDRESTPIEAITPLGYSGRIDSVDTGATIMAQADSIRLALRTQPFRPFELTLVDGSVYKVKHPDYLSIPPVRRPRGAIFFTPGNGGEDEYDAHWIDLALISEIIVPGSAAGAPTQPPENGE
jgi:hypothetical protein